LYGAQYHGADSLQSLRAGVLAGVGGTGLHIVEMRSDRARNLVLHREAWARVAAALATASTPERAR
jgi:2-succinyl-5-enolpyruvyl-6-hydroxy-3-cyclohexene-1-carboxylate synthase